MKKIIIILTIITSVLIYIEIKDKEVIIPSSAIRLRVIPNSNSIEDQNMKNKVKKYLEKNTYTLLEDTTTIEEARTIITNNLNDIDTSVNKIFKLPAVSMPTNFLAKTLFFNILFIFDDKTSVIIIGNPSGTATTIIVTLKVKA